MKKEGMNKKAQGLPITTLLLIVLGIVVVVVLILGFTQGFDAIFGKLKFLPSDLESVVQSCNTYAKSNLEGDYCRSFREANIAGRKQFVNCQYSEVSGLLVEKIQSNSCGSESANARKQCEDIRTQKGSSFDAEKTYINGINCADRGVGFDLPNCDTAGGIEILIEAGENAVSQCEKENDKRNVLPRGEYQYKENHVCCVYDSCEEKGGIVSTTACSDGKVLASTKEGANQVDGNFCCLPNN